MPTNLFKVWRIPEAYIAGHFIDYLAPKLYLSQIAIWVLWLVTLLTTRGRDRLRAHFPLLRRLALLILAIGLLSLANFLVWRDPSLLWWSLEFVTGPVLIAVWVLMFAADKPTLLWWALLVSGIFQAGVGIQQYITQHSLAGFWFLGEPSLRFGNALAVSSFQSQHWFLPYGTTPHPNILATWLVMGILSSFFLWHIGKKKSWVIVISSGVMSLCLWWTESWTAWLSLPLLLWMWYAIRQQWLSRFGLSSAKKIVLIVLLVAQLLWIGSAQGLGVTLQRWPGILRQVHLETTSITRRVALQREALKLIQEHPWGYSLRKYYQSVYESEMSYSGARFLQPVHQSSLFIVISFGLCSFLLLFFFILTEHNYYPLFIVLALAILPIFNLDHYMLTLISGQYLTILILLTLYFLTKVYRPYK